MNPMMKKLLEKKLEQGGKELSDDESSAQMSVLKDLKGQMGGMMGDKMNKLKKVSVMSDSEKGLKEGLSKAEDIVNNGQEDSDSRGILHDPEEEMEMHGDEAEVPDEHKTPEELDAKIQSLMSLKKSKEESQ